MGYSTVNINKVTALNKVKMSKNEVDSASCEKLFFSYPDLKDIVSACESDHNHIILNLKNGHFVDYKLIK